MSYFANTPKPPYFAVIFTSTLVNTEKNNRENESSYDEMATRMVELASKQPGFLGIESARQDLGITVSYWSDLESIKQWKLNEEHQSAQKLGRSDWYSAFKVRISKVERDYNL